MTARTAATLTERCIDVAALLVEARSDADGGVDLFLGTVRDHSDGEAVSALEYEAYVPMAEALMRDLAAKVARDTGVSALLAVHRLGRLAIGDVAIAVVAAAPHRAEAFAACRALVDAIKSEVPIFKREHLAGSTRWVGAAPAVGVADA